jgi:hypothetical protein
MSFEAGFFYKATTVLPANKFCLWPILYEKTPKSVVVPKTKSGKVVFQQIFKIICEKRPNNSLTKECKITAMGQSNLR